MQRSANTVWYFVPFLSLQFCNESLNMKMQEQADDTESLRNK